MAAVIPQPCQIVLRNKQAYLAMAPLFGDTGAGAIVTGPGPWIQVPPGSALELALIITALVGTLQVWIETCAQVTGGPLGPLVNVDSPRPLGWFKQNPGAALPTTIPLSVIGTTDNYIRVNATPGAGAAAAWTVAGSVIAAAFAQST